MKKVLLVGCCVAWLSGCTIDPNSCTSEHSYTESWTDPATGLTLLPSSKMYVTREEVAKIYEGVEACMGLTAPGPDVKYASFYEVFIGGAPGTGETLGAGGGAVYVSPKLVMINTDPGRNEMFARDCHVDREYLSHEFIHHLLHQNGLGQFSGNHHPEYFLQKCIIENTHD